MQFLQKTLNGEELPPNHLNTMTEIDTFFQVKIFVCLSSEYLIAKCKIVLAKLVNKQVVFAVSVAFVVRLKTLSYFRRNARDQNSDLLKS